MARTKPRAELQYDTDLARGLRRARLASGVGFKEAATLADLDISSIWRIEKGVFTPTLPTLHTLLRLYGANLNIGPDGLMLTWLGSDEDHT
jgi:transcriptional regulator with XRE-family HTH domain